MKPTLGDAVASIEAQTFRDFECILMDSGQWIDRDDELSNTMRELVYGAQRLSRFKLRLTNEGPDLRAERCPVGWATNEVIRSGLVRGEYVCTFYDDDVYEPTFLEAMVGFLDEHPEHGAVWCSQDRVRWWPDGRTEHGGCLSADRELTPGNLLDRVDGGQFMFRRSMLDLIGDPWLPEDPGRCHHSDGIFLEKLAVACGVIPPLDLMLYTHRFTPYSTYSPV
jgi:hypothetical protein